MNAKKILEALNYGDLLPRVISIMSGSHFLSNCKNSPSLYQVRIGEMKLDSLYLFVNVGVAYVMADQLSGEDCCLVNWLGKDFYAYEIEN